MIKQYPNIKNPLVKFANDYDIAYLYDYFLCVISEMRIRRINMNEIYNKNIRSIFEEKTELNNFYDLKFKEDNEEYSIICRWNLYEKHLRNMITDEEWQKIEYFINSEIK
jgi:hypothetical protein